MRLNRVRVPEDSASKGERERVSVRQLGGPGACFPGKILKLKSSEMARNASKTVNTDGNF